MVQSLQACEPTGSGCLIIIDPVQIFPASRWEVSIMYGLHRNELIDMQVYDPDKEYGAYVSCWRFFRLVL